MNRHNREFQSVLMFPTSETPDQYKNLFEGTVIYEHVGLSAQALGSIPAGYTLWVSQDDGKKSNEHFSGTVSQIYRGWKKARVVTIEKTKICAGTFVYF